MRYGTLFSGIDGFAVGFDRLGWDLRWQVEQDPFCLDVLRHHWPDVPKHEDVRDVGAHNLERVDVLAGGFPCQDISTAGLGAGIGGARSGLWTEMLRVVGELRPRYVVVENVAALRTRGLDVVLGGLAEIGFDAEWDVLRASDVGAPHQRPRIWIVAYPSGARRRKDAGGAHADEGAYARRRADNDHVAGRAGSRGLSAAGRPDVGDAEGDGRRSRRTGRPDPAGEREPESFGSLQDADSGSLQPWRTGGRVAQTGGPGWWAVEPPVGRVAHGVPNRLAQLSALGNALVPQIPEWIGRRIEEWEASRMTSATGSKQRYEEDA